MDDALLLPPPPQPGMLHSLADEARVVAYVDGLMQESYEARRELDVQADRNENLHRGRSRLEQPPEGYEACDLNRVRNVDIAHIQVQSEQTPRVKLNPRETGEPPMAFLDTRVDLGDLEDPMGGGILKTFLSTLEPGAFQGKPLSDADRRKCEKAVDAGLLPLEALINLTDRARADAEQTVFDAKWDEASTDFYLREATFKKTIIGWQFALYGYDDQVKRHTLWNPSHLQVFVDPDCTDIRDAAHAELLQFYDLRRAQAAYPDAAAKLASAAIVGGVNNFGFPWRIPEKYQKMIPRRAMVAVRHAWIRYWPFPLDPEAAAQKGKLQWRDQVVVPGSPAVMDEVGNELQPAVPDQTQPAYFFPDGRPAQMPFARGSVAGGETPDGLGALDPAWPTRPGIREICIVGTSVVYDRETEYGDIPLPHFVDLPIIDSPFGEGQPEALEPLQMAVNSVLSDLATYFHYFGMPAVATPVSVAKRLPGFSEGVYASIFKTVLEIPDDLLKEFGFDKLIGFIQPPTIPADYWQFFNLLLTLLDKEGQVTEALEGEGKAQWSGELVARLQEAARGLIAWKSLRMEESIKYLARQMLHTNRVRVSAAECCLDCSKYPLYVGEEIKRRPAELDIEVAIVSGSGQLEDRAKSDSLALYANGQGPLSATSLLESFGRDPKLEAQNKIAEAEARAKAASQIQAAGGGVPAVGAPPAAAPPGAVPGFPSAPPPGAVAA